MNTRLHINHPQSSHNDRAGTKAKISTTISMVNTKVTACLEIDITDSPVTPDTTKRLSPSGGVMNPMPRAVIMKIQKCISCIPISSASGRSRGESITMLGVVSITHPATIRITSIRNMIRY